MPRYDFKCSTCGSVCEVSRSATDDSPVPCPECGAETRRVFTPVGVHFKGSGFHNTDYKPKPAASCDAAGSSSSCAGCPASGSSAAS